MVPSISRPERVAAALEREILDQHLDTGARVGLRTELIARFSVGANVMNEALRILRERGLVVVRPGVKGGVYVGERPPQVRLGALDLWFQNLASDPVQLFETRTQLDDMFAGLAVQRASPADIRAMEWAMEDIRKWRKEPRGFLDANMRFHLAIARAARLPLLENLYEGIIAILSGGLIRAAFVGERAEEIIDHSVQVHTQLLKTIRDGDVARLGAVLNQHRMDLVRVTEPSQSASGGLRGAKPAATG